MPRKTPQTKKAEAYKHERRSAAWSSDKADRRNRPRAKALARRSARRAVRQAARVVPGAVALENLDGLVDRVAVVTTKAEHEPVPFDRSAVPLAEWVRERASRRVDRTGWSFFASQRYEPAKHRKAFTAFLANIVAGGTADSAQLARLFYEMLYVPDDVSCASGERRYQWWPTRSRWLRSFLRDAPEWSQRLEAWIRAELGHGGDPSNPSNPGLQRTAPSRRR